MIPHEPENIFYRGRGNLRRGGAPPPGADLYGLASHDRRLVGTDEGELDRSRRRWLPRFYQVEIRSAQCKRVVTTSKLRMPTHVEKDATHPPRADARLCNMMESGEYGALPMLPQRVLKALA
jgi:hypothetical protein